MGHRKFIIILSYIAINSFAITAPGRSGSNYNEKTSSRIIPIPYPGTILLRDPEVVSELRLTETQIRATGDGLDKVERDLFRLRDVPYEKRQEPAEGLIEMLNGDLDRILNVSQRQRYYQLLWQSLKLYAFQEGEMVKRLKISSQQEEDISAILMSLNNRIIRRQNSPGDNEDDEAYYRRIYLESRNKLLGILDSRQQQILPRLLGQGYDFKSVKQRACKVLDFEPVQAWINTDDPAAIKLEGKVTVIHFYAFGCINCIRNLPFYNAWVEDFDSGDFQVIGIHRPETKQERILEKVKAKALEYKMQYPIAVDADSLNWDKFANRIWPSIYLVDKEGFIRFWWYGELNWQGVPTEKLMRSRIKELMAE